MTPTIVLPDGDPHMAALLSRPDFAARLARLGGHPTAAGADVLGRAHAPSPPYVSITSKGPDPYSLRRGHPG